MRLRPKAHAYTAGKILTSVNRRYAGDFRRNRMKPGGMWRADIRFSRNQPFATEPKNRETVVQLQQFPLLVVNSAAGAVLQSFKLTARLRSLLPVDLRLQCCCKFDQRDTRPSPSSPSAINAVSARPSAFPDGAFSDRHQQTGTRPLPPGEGRSGLLDPGCAIARWRNFCIAWHDLAAAWRFGGSARNELQTIGAVLFSQRLVLIFQGAAHRGIGSGKGLVCESDHRNHGERCAPGFQELTALV